MGGHGSFRIGKLGRSFTGEKGQGYGTVSQGCPCKATTNLADLLEGLTASGLLSNPPKDKFWPHLSALSGWRWRAKKREFGESQC